MSERTVLKASALVSGLSGAVILFSVIFPIISYQGAPQDKYAELLSPVVETKNTIRLEDVDYTKPDNWFVGAPKNLTAEPSEIDYYTLSIPKLGIENATVKIAGEDLSKSLIQYPGTAPPGKIGNTVVFGHSILPQFYDPKNYLAIFSTLPTLNKGDEIEISYDGVFYRYRVEEMFEVKPTQVEVLEQDKDDSWLTLITCVPPGHPLKPRRLIVRARVVPPGQANADFRN